MIRVYLGLTGLGFILDGSRLGLILGGLRVDLGSFRLGLGLV